ncbi:MAG: hypothetical protein HQ567_18875 [Candidatus Nealsonbacteria bacterium]|nr:hypothetical protein [Candidatus Nealsonbacteria bacterium]
MTSRLLYKEFRETIWIAAAAMAVELFFGFTATSLSYQPIPFILDSFPSTMGVVWACLAIGLGLRQTVGESAFGTFPFLLHRPAGRQRSGISSMTVSWTGPPISSGITADRRDASGTVSASIRTSRTTTVGRTTPEHSRVGHRF